MTTTNLPTTIPTFQVVNDYHVPTGVRIFEDGVVLNERDFRKYIRNVDPSDMGFTVQQPLPVFVPKMEPFPTLFPEDIAKAAAAGAVAKTYREGIKAMTRNAPRAVILGLYQQSETQSVYVPETDLLARFQRGLHYAFLSFLAKQPRLSFHAFCLLPLGAAPTEAARLELKSEFMAFVHKFDKEVMQKHDVWLTMVSMETSLSRKPIEGFNDMWELSLNTSIDLRGSEPQPVVDPNTRSFEATWGHT